MTAAERVIALFDRISEAPDAIPRLRYFVFDLAIRGDLVDQCPDDEPAIELLNRIDAQKRHVAGKRAIDRMSKRPTTSEETGCFTLPQGWIWSSLSQIGYINPRNHEAVSEQMASFVPMSLISSDYGTESEHIQKSWSDIKSGYTHFANGDVGLAKITPCYENRKSAVFRNLTGGIGSGTTELLVVRPVFVNPDFILVFLKSPTFLETGISKMTGTAGQKRVPADYFAWAPFPLPPLAEQGRIVAKVYELMALCDRLEAAQKERECRRDRLVGASLARLVDTDGEEFGTGLRFHFRQWHRVTAKKRHIQQLRESLSHLAVHGAVVRQDATDEPSSDWLRRVGRFPVGRPLIQPFTVPRGWTWCHIADTFDVAGGIQKTPQRTPRSNAYPYLGVSNVYRGRLNLANVKSFELRPGELEQRRLQRGDILIIEGNGSLNEVGRCAKWNSEIEHCVHQNHVIRCRPFDPEISDFVLLFLNSPDGIEVMQQLAITTSGLYSLSVGKIRQIQIPLPPKPEQRRIVAKVEELKTTCDRLETALDAGRAARAALLEATLRDALAEANQPTLTATNK